MYREGAAQTGRGRRPAMTGNTFFEHLQVGGELRARVGQQLLLRQVRLVALQRPLTTQLVQLCQSAIMITRDDAGQM